MGVYYVYVLQSESTGQCYVGHTQNLQKRLARHHEGRSRFTKSRGPFKIVYVEEYDSRSEAAKREAEIKRKKSRQYIRELISRSSPNLSA